MKRVVKDPVIRKQELTAIALKQFLQNGYENTSVRSILKEVNGEIGMFYHYFNSKDEIYKEALELFNQNFLVKLENVSKTDNISFIEKVNMMFLCTQEAIAEYSNLTADNLNDAMLNTIHQKTLLSMIPFLERMLEKETNVELPNINLHFLSEFLLFGVSSIIHDKDYDFAFKQQQIYKILFHFIHFKQDIIV